MAEDKRVNKPRRKVRRVGGTPGRVTNDRRDPRGQTYPVGQPGSQ